MKKHLIILVAACLALLCIAALPVSALEPNDTYYREGYQWYLATNTTTSETGMALKTLNISDPQYMALLDQWDRALWGGIDAPAAWDISTGNSDIIVAVIDTGVDIDHPDLKDNIWTNTGEIPGNGIDDDGNGYIDDIHGWNFGNESAVVTDFKGHGTACAGLIGAIGNNTEGIAGVNWKVKIMPIVFGNTEKNFSDAIHYAVDNGARIISYSMGVIITEDNLKKTDTKTILDALKYAESHDVLFVNAAGNEVQNLDTVVYYPEIFNRQVSNMLVVAASTVSNGLAWFSNYGKETVDLAAPGSVIWSTTPKTEFVTRFLMNASDSDSFDYLGNDSKGGTEISLGIRLNGSTSGAIGSRIPLTVEELKGWIDLGEIMLFNLSGSDLIQIIFTTKPLSQYASLDELKADLANSEANRNVVVIQNLTAKSKWTMPILLYSGYGTTLLSYMGNKSLYPAIYYQGTTPASEMTHMGMPYLSRYRVVGHTYYGYVPAVVQKDQNSVGFQDTTLDGTSFSCPLVSGTAALLLSINPELSVADLKTAILSTVDPIPELADKVRSGGQLNLGKAAAMAANMTPTRPTQKSPAPVIGLVAGLGIAALVLARLRR